MFTRGVAGCDLPAKGSHWTSLALVFRSPVENSVTGFELPVAGVLLPAIGVARDPRQAVGTLEPRLDLGTRKLAVQELDRGHRELVEVDLDLAGRADLAPREVEQSLDDARDARGLLGNDLGVLFNRIWILRLALDRARAPGDHVER